MASKTISTILNLKDNFSKTIDKTTKNTKDFQRQLKHTQNSVKAMKDGVNQAFKGIALKMGGLVAGIGLANFAKESIMLASDLDEVKNVVDTTFGKSSKTIDNWSKNAIKAFGIGELQAKQFNGTLGAMMKTAGFSGDTLAKMTTDVAGLAGDIASFRNMEPEEAFEKLKSIVTGSSEPVEALGLDFRVASLEAYAMSKGIKKAYKNMSNAEQIQLRYNYTMEKTKDMQGDFNKTNKGFANQLRIAKARLKQLGASVASYTLPPLNKLLNMFNNFMSAIPKFGSKIKQVFKDLSQVTNSTDFFKVFMDYVNNLLFTKLPNDIAMASSNIIGEIVKFFTDIYDNAVRIGKDLSTPFMGAFNSIKAFANDRVQEIIDIIGNIGGSTLVTDGFNVLRDTLKEVLDGVKNVFNFINDNWGLLEPIIAGVTGAIVAYNIAMKAAVVWTNLVKAAQIAWAAVTGICNTAMMLLNGTLAISTFGWVIISIGALIAIGVALYQNWDTIKAKASELWSKMTEVFDGIKTSITEKVESIKKSVFEKWQAIRDFMSNPIKGTVDIVKNGLSSVNVGKNALGTQYWKGGLTKINEHGGEIINLPNGSKVIPADKSKNMLNKQGVNVNVIVQGNVLGNNEFINEVGNTIAARVQLVLANM